MSYILDALRRADAERVRGEVPGLHTQQFGALPEDDEAPRRPRLLIGMVVVLALALAAVLAWTFLGGNEPAPKPIAPTPITPVPITPAPPPIAAAPIAAAPTLPEAASPVAPPARATAAATTPVPASVTKELRPARPVARPPARREAAASSAPAAGGDRLYTLAELPEAIRRELPKIVFGGASYSGDKASRMVILNGQVFHEGDTVAPGLVLQQVRQKNAVLAYKGYRYELGF
ncbi:MAG: general secretion pathway protein GspB [Caldimonas sp.]